MKNSIERRNEFVLLFDVENGNPNGDPDAGNMPRIDAETNFGIVTDVCLKRKVRNYVELVKAGEKGYDIYVREGVVLNAQNKRAYDALGIDPKNEKDARARAKELTRFMCDSFYDIRAFGAVMTTEVNCGQVRGPVQFNFARSVDPIVPQEVSITRMAVTNERDAEKERTMGRKHIVPTRSTGLRVTSPPTSPRRPGSPRKISNSCGRPWRACSSTTVRPHAARWLPVS